MHQITYANCIFHPLILESQQDNPARKTNCKKTAADISRNFEAIKILLLVEQGDKESTHCTQYETSVSQKTKFIHSTAREITTLHRKKHHLAEGWWIKINQKVTKKQNHTQHSNQAWNQSNN
jgi:hypothetical protein